MERTRPTVTQAMRWGGAWFALVMACFLLAGAPPPHVNESHYWVKARHYHDPSFAAGDLFVESQDAHALFLATFGRLTQWTDLETAAWWGRWTVWIALAGSMMALGAALDLGAAGAVGVGLLLIALQRATPMAGEWMIGGVEAKGLAFALALLAVACVTRGRWEWALVMAGAAAGWHVLIGGWLLLLTVVGSVVALGGSVLRRPSWLPAAAVAIVLSAIGWWPAWQLNRGVPAEVAAEAAVVYVYRRLAHHLVFQRFPLSAIAAHFVAWGLFSVGWFALRGERAVQHVGKLVWGAAGLLLVGIAISLWGEWSPKSAAQVARFYWFRTSDWLLPVGLSVLAARAAPRTSSSSRDGWRLAAVGLVAFGLFCGIDIRHQWKIDVPPAAQQGGLFRRESPEKWREALAEWQAVCRWAGEHTAPGDVWLTPRHQQTFKWYSGRAEVVNWKDIPQDARSVVQWWERYQEVYPREVVRYGLVAHGESGLRRLAVRYGARWILIDRRWSQRPLSWKRVYPERLDVSTRFVVYRIPTDDQSLRRGRDGG